MLADGLVLFMIIQSRIIVDTGEPENGLYRNYLLVGNSGYDVRPFLITPLDNPINPVQHMFN